MHTDIFYHLAKDGIVHELIEVLPHSVLSSFVFLCIIVDVCFEPSKLAEAENMMHLP